MNLNITLASAWRRRSNEPAGRARHGLTRANVGALAWFRHRASAHGYFRQTAIEYGPCRRSTRTSRNPASRIHETQSAPV